MTETAALPQFLIIGAIKAATTWVTWQLQRHEGIFLPGPEPHYFSREYHRGPDWYARFFAAAKAGQRRGEKTADYLADPNAARRIARVVPRIPMIVQLRDPVDRAYSDYCMLLRRGTVKGTPEDYLDPVTSTFRRFIDNGRYHTHLTRWFDLFDRDRFLVLTAEEVRSAPIETIEACCRHLGVEPPAADLVSKARVNDGSAAYLPLPLRRALGPAKRIVGPFRGTRLFEAVRGVLARQIDYPPMSADLRQRLRDHYVPEIEGTARLLGINLDHWLVGSAGSQ